MSRIVVGVGPEHRGWEAIPYGAALARQLGGQLLLAHVHPRPWNIHNQGDVDAEWLAFLQQESTALLEEAAALVDPAVPCTLHSHADAGSGKGLAHVASEHEADLIVVGSAGQEGSGEGSGEPRRSGLHVGTTADHLLHASEVPVTLVPAGWHLTAECVARVTVGWHGGAGTQSAVAEGCALAAQTGTAVRLLSFVIGPPPSFTGAEGSAARLRDQVLAQLAGAAEEIRDGYGLAVDAWASSGETLQEAVRAAPWDPGELFVIGSSGAGALRRAFLGDASGKILRAVGVPTMTVPRAAAT